MDKPQTFAAYVYTRVWATYRVEGNRRASRNGRVSSHPRSLRLLSQPLCTLPNKQPTPTGLTLRNTYAQVLVIVVALLLLLGETSIYQYLGERLDQVPSETRSLWMAARKALDLNMRSPTYIVKRMQVLPPGV